MNDMMHEAAKNVIECQHVAKYYREGGMRVDVLADLNLAIAQGERVAIIGTSGAGKSTLLHIMGGLDQPSQGEVWVAGKNINKLPERERSCLRNQTLGFVYQFHHLLPEFTVLENVCMPLLIGKVHPKIAQEKAKALLEKVGLMQRLKHKLGELSGGERQRTAIARALVTDPKCLLADEPTGNLDHKTADQVYNTMLELNQEFKTSFVIVTHDHRLTEHMDRTLSIVDGQLDSSGKL